MRTFGVGGKLRSSVSFAMNLRGLGAVEESCWFYTTACLVHAERKRKAILGARNLLEMFNTQRKGMNNQLGAKVKLC